MGGTDQASAVVPNSNLGDDMFGAGRVGAGLGRVASAKPGLIVSGLVYAREAAFRCGSFFPRRASRRATADLRTRWRASAQRLAPWAWRSVCGRLLGAL